MFNFWCNFCNINFDLWTSTTKAANWFFSVIGTIIIDISCKFFTDNPGCAAPVWYLFKSKLIKSWFNQISFISTIGTTNNACSVFLNFPLANCTFPLNAPCLPISEYSPSWLYSVTYPRIPFPPKHGYLFVSVS